MADDSDRNKRFRAERKRQSRRLTRIQRDTAAEVRRLLKLADQRIRAQLGVMPPPTEWQAFHLPKLQDAIRKAMADMETRAASRLQQAAGASWSAGVDSVDKPIAAGLQSARFTGLMPEIDTRQLMAMRNFMTDRIKDISTTVANRINAEMGLVAIGGQTPSQAAGTIGRLIAGGRDRANTIIRTELGRAYAAAGQQRMAQAQALLPGLKKQWRRSGKIHSRPAHDIADGQVRDVDEPFLVNGAELMFPRDPAAPASETINCGCDSLPFMESWEVREPGRKPFTNEELAKSPSKRLLRDLGN
jgi:Phage Mu protein F like protein